MTRNRCLPRFAHLAALRFFALAACAMPAFTLLAEEVFWRGGNSQTAFHADENWAGGTAPLNDSTKDTGNVAVFGIQALSSEASLAGSRSISGLRFEAMADGSSWKIRRGGGDAHTLTLGAAGISIPQAGTEILFDCNLRLQGNQKWIFAGENSTLTVEGDISGPSYVSILGPGKVQFSSDVRTGGLAVSRATVDLMAPTNSPLMEILLADNAVLHVSDAEFAAGALSVPSSARMILSPSVKTLRFADSSEKPWDAGELLIEGFQPDKMKIIFGSTAAALTPQQLRCIRFESPTAGTPSLSAQGELMVR